MHGVEELVEPPYLFAGPVIYTLIGEDGSKVEMPCRSHGFIGWAQRYDRLEPLLQDGELQVGKVLKATAHLVEVEAMWVRGEQALRRDPFFFVEERFG